MGRRKQRRSATTKKRELPEDTTDILLGLLDLCGGEGNNKRQALVTSLQRLSILLAKNPSQKEKTDIDSWLMQVEDTASTVREKVELLRPSGDRSEAIFLLQELETISRKQEMHISWNHFARYLVSAIQMATQREEKALGEILAVLDNLYDDDLNARESETSNMRRRLDQVQCIVDILQRKELVQRPQFQEGLSIIGQLQEDQSSPVSKSTDTPKYELPMESFAPTSEHCHIGDSRVMSTSTIWEALDAFLSLSSDDEPSVHRLLLVGPEGSGKTFICDKIEYIATESAQGRFGLATSDNGITKSFTDTATSHPS